MERILNEETIELLKEQIQILVKDIKILQAFLLIMALILFAFLGILAKLGAQKLAEKLDLFKEKNKDSSTVEVIDSPKSSESDENHQNVSDEVEDSITGKNIGASGKEKNSDADAYINNADEGSGASDKENGHAQLPNKNSSAERRGDKRR